MVRRIRKHISDGYERKPDVPTPGTRFHKLGTIFSRTTGLIKSGALPAEEIPRWYSVFKAFPPKYEPRFNRPPLDVVVKEIYYPEDKLRAKIKRWETFDLKSTKTSQSEKLVAKYLEMRKSRDDDDKLIEELLQSQSGDRNSQSSPGVVKT